MDKCKCGRPAVSGIRAKRLKAGVSLEEMSARTGFSKSYIKMMEGGRRACTGATRDRVLGAIEGRSYSAPPPVVAFDEQQIGSW